MSDQKTSSNITLHISPDKLAGHYANVTSVTVGVNEVIVDFALHVPRMDRADVVSRIIMTPDAAKAFLSAFQNAVLDFDNIKQKHAA